VRRRLRMLLEAIEEAQGSDLSEQVRRGTSLTVEHVLPQEWHAHWPLPDVDDWREAEARRDEAKHRIGNLTLTTQPLNSTQNNAGWIEKRKLLDRYSLMLISKDIVSSDRWDEKTIADRTARLSDQILRIWPGPLTPRADATQDAPLEPQFSRRAAALDDSPNAVVAGIPSADPRLVGELAATIVAASGAPPERLARDGGPEVFRTFDAAMLNVYESASQQAGYRATRFLQKVRRDGGLKAAQYFLRQPGVSAGFLALEKAAKLDLSTEYIVLRPQFAGLFSDSELRIARQRLLDHGMLASDLPEGQMQGGGFDSSAPA
jgi:hypothetical protein